MLELANWLQGGYVYRWWRLSFLDGNIGCVFLLFGRAMISCFFHVILFLRFVEFCEAKVERVSGNMDNFVENPYVCFNLA